MDFDTPVPRRDAPLQDKISYVLLGQTPAVEFFACIWKVLHFWDDLIDRDQPVTDADINAAMFTALVTLPTNTFYRAHHASLSPVLVNAIANWQAANRFEAMGDERLLQQAFVIRSDYANILIQAAYLVGGPDWLMHVTPIIRDMWTYENFDAYKSNLQREKAERTGTQAALLQEWYAQETAEYERHGLTVFNAAMLGDTEASHVQAMRDIIEPPLGAVTVDMGCGVGGISRLLAEQDATATFYCVTNVPVQIEALQGIPRITPVEADFHHVPLADGIADVVLFSESFGYGDAERLVSEAYRLLKPGGKLFIKDGVSVTGAPLYSPVWLWTTQPQGWLDSYAEAIGFTVTVSREIDCMFDRYHHFVATNPVMQARYRDFVARDDQATSWCWLLTKQGTPHVL